MNWKDDGSEIKGFVDDSGKQRSRPQNTEKYFKPSLTWSFVSSSYFGVRYSDPGAIFDVGGSSAFPEEDNIFWLAGYLCSKMAFDFMKVMNPTLNFQVGNVASLPILENGIKSIKVYLSDICRELIDIHRRDWDSFETSYNFRSNPIFGKIIGLLSQLLKSFSS